MIDQVWASRAIECCLRHGIDHFFLAPGSRCTPLTLAVARVADQSRANVIQHFDERGLAFAALGYGRATGKPGVFICTSGTAVANAFPAVIESAMESVPMLLFTADRPPELRDTGANQTIDQQNIFGNYPKLFLDMPAPTDDDLSKTFLADSLRNGISNANHGPVHINWMFREPFTTSDQYQHDAQASESPAKYNPDAQASGFPILPENQTEPQIELRGNVLIALGRCNPDEAQQVLELSKRMNCPILSDVTSGISTASFELPSEFSLPRPDTILHLGGRIVSKSWHQWTQQLEDEGVDFIHVTPTGQTINPNHLPVQKFHTSLTNLESKIVGSPSVDSFRNSWSNAAAKRVEILESQFATEIKLNEPAIAHFLSKNCPASDGFFIGNSTPIRDLDWYGAGDSNRARNIAANRGASGIDGLLATATGYAAGLQKRTTVLLGDLSALHDLNSLALIAESQWPLIVVVVNNQGGHIFDLLPVRESQYFEKFFATPHEYRFEDAAKMFGIDYRRITEIEDFTNSYRDACAQRQSIIIELVTDRQHNIKVRNQIRKEIQECSSQS